jgi:uncharacterized protein YdiU (UPF0061 family)
VCYQIAEWNLQKLSEAFIPFLDESQVIEVTTQLQNLGHSAKEKQRQGRVHALGGYESVIFYVILVEAIESEFSLGTVLGRQSQATILLPPTLCVM